MTHQDQPVMPASLIEKSGLPLRKVAAIADLDIKTVMKAKNTNTWPAQHRTRSALMRALGLEVPAEEAGGQA